MRLLGTRKGDLRKIGNSAKLKRLGLLLLEMGREIHLYLWLQWLHWQNFAIMAFFSLKTSYKSVHLLLEMFNTRDA